MWFLWGACMWSEFLLMRVTPTVQRVPWPGIACVQYVCICPSGECSQTGDVGEYSISLILNTFPACFCLHSSFRPVKARDHSDEALPLWCMPPWSSPVIYYWRPANITMRSRCTRVFARAVRPVGSQEHGNFYLWVKGVVESRLWYFPFVLDCGSLGFIRFPLQLQHLRQFFKLSGGNMLSPWPAKTTAVEAWTDQSALKKIYRTSLQILMELVWLHTHTHISVMFLRMTTAHVTSKPLLKYKVCLAFVHLKAPKFILCNYCDISASVSLLNEVEQFCLC